MSILEPDHLAVSARQIGFHAELKEIINKYDQETASNTPDFILAQFMNTCLLAFNAATKRRDMHSGMHSAEPSTKKESSP